MKILVKFQVPGVEGLCVRVVSSIDRAASVKRSFREFLKDENYPSQFPYKSKVYSFVQQFFFVFLFGISMALV